MRTNVISPGPTWSTPEWEKEAKSIECELIQMQKGVTLRSANQNKETLRKSWLVAVASLSRLVSADLKDAGPMEADKTLGKLCGLAVQSAENAKQTLSLDVFDGYRQLEARGVGISIDQIQAVQQMLGMYVSQL